MIRLLGGIVSSIALALAIPAFAQDQPGDYRLGPKDLLEIRVFEIPELNLERRVTDSGTIALPMVGELAVNGMTANEVHDRLESLLTAKYVNRANVSVVVKEFANKPVSIVGAVQRPGALQVSGHYTLLQAISAAGGLTGDAGKKIYVLRKSENGLADTLEISSDDLLRGSSARWNIPIFPSDVVNIPARSSVKLFCLGEVKQPGALEFDSDDRISVLSVIAKAGGLTDRASSAILIKRRGPDGKDLETRANYKRIISGRDPDISLKADDVLIVKESFF